MSDDYRPTHNQRRNLREFAFAVLGITALVLAAVASAVILVLGD